MGLDKDDNDFIEYYFKSMYKQLYEYAVRLLQNHHLAEELVQETFLIACDSIQQIQENAIPQRWFYVTLRNLIHNTLRKYAVMNRYHTDMPEEDSIINDKEDDISYHAVYTDLLGQEDFDLLTLVVLDGDTIQHAAEQLGITMEACKKRVQRAKQKLKRLLEEDEKNT